MRKLLFSLLFFCASLNSSFAGDVDKKLHQQCLYPTIYIGKADQTSYGSGVIVRSDKVNDTTYKNVFLSCAHLVDDTSIDYEVKQFIYEEWSQVKEVKTYPALFNSIHRAQDLAIGVFFSSEPMPVAELDFTPKLYIGNEVFRIGCGLGDGPRLDYGKLTYYKKKPLPTFRTSVMTVPGDSGSPLFHNYKVIGIMVSIRSYKNLPVFNISYSVPLERFRNWSNENDHAFDYAWSDKELPKMPFHFLEFNNYTMK